MNKTIKVISGLLFVVLVAIVLSSILQVPVYAGFGALLAASFFVPKGVALMGVTVEIWQNDIIGNLFKNNQFATHAKNGDQYVIGGRIVHIPTAGAPDVSLKNATVFPITAVQRADDAILYALDNYFQKPKFVQNVEQYELSYDKRQSIMGEQQSQLIQDAMDGLLFRWQWQGTTIGTTPANSILTKGAPTAATISGATGNRLSLDKTAFSTVKLAMDRANISPNGRYALLTADHYQQFLDTLSDAALTNFYRIADIENGVIGTYLGFRVIMRSSVSRWREVAGVWTPVDEQSPAFAATEDDSAASLFWQEDAVERARGEVNVFENAGRPEYYGDVFSMNMRLGGRQRRKEGVYAIIEDASA